MKKILVLCLLMYVNVVYATDVELTWYDGDTTINGPTSCTVGGTFLPPTPPARTGFVFAGWKIKEIHIPCAQQIQNLDTSINGRGSSYYGYTRLDGATGSRESNYGLTTGSGQWAVQFSYGTVWGMANCNSEYGRYPNIGTLTLESSGKYCWCQVTGFSPSGSNYTQGPQCTTTVSSSWGFAREYSTNATNCVPQCVSYCANTVRTEANFRVALFGAVGQ